MPLLVILVVIVMLVEVVLTVAYEACVKRVVCSVTDFLIMLVGALLLLLILLEL